MSKKLAVTVILTTALALAVPGATAFARGGGGGGGGGGGHMGGDGRRYIGRGFGDYDTYYTCWNSQYGSYGACQYPYYY